MTTDLMLLEIVSYKYDAFGYPYIFLAYSQDKKEWSIMFRNPIDFKNDDIENGFTPQEACRNTLKFIKDNPNLFSK